MLARREFIKLSAMLAAGAALPIIPGQEIEAAVIGLTAGRGPRPILRLHGHKKSGCAFHPELTDIWEGGGAELPEFV